MTKKRPIEYPLAEEVARAIVAAARLEGEDPIAVAKGRARSRARVYAFVALAHRFHTVNYTPLMRMCGAKAESAFSAAVAAAQTARGDATKNGDWFRLDALNQVVAACGWPAMTAIDAELRRMAQKPRSAAAGCDSIGAETPTKPALDGGKPQETPCDSIGAEIDMPMSISQPSEAVEKIDIAALAVEAPAQPELKSGPIRRPDPQAEESEKPARNMPEIMQAPAKVSDAARALATFQRAMVDRKPTAKPGPEPRRAAFANAAAIELSYRPDRAAAQRSVDVVSYEFFGDPPPHRSALALKLEGGKA